MKGSIPPPCSGFSLTVTDEDQAVMFGGRTPSGESSEARVLHLPTMVSQFLNTNMAKIYKGRKIKQLLCLYRCEVRVT